MSELPAAVRDLLACPRCRGVLTDSSDVPGCGLDCALCGLRFAVRDGIPVLLLEYAEPITP